MHQSGDDQESLEYQSSSHSLSYFDFVNFTSVVGIFFFPKALSSESFERLPVFNKSAWRHYTTSPEADDWSNPSKEPRDASKSKYKANR